MKILFPDRILNRHVGGNTTYARHLNEGLVGRGIETGVMPSGRHPITTLIKESLAGMKSPSNEVLHYSADTGPLVRTRAHSVVTVHGVASRWIDVARNSRQESVWRTRVARAIASTDALITVSQSAADDIAEVFGVDRNDITVIPHGIDSKAFSGPRLLSDELAVKIPSTYALYLGNVEPRKNLIELVRAFESPTLNAMGVPLVIAGRAAWNFSEIMTEISQSKNVVYLGFVSDEDRSALMQNCSIFVFPSLYEGFGLPVLEAMAAGVPVATSRRGSLAEVAGPAYRIDDLSSVGIAESVSSALSDTDWLRRASDEGRDWAAKFRWADSIDAHLAVYRKVVDA